MHSKDLLTNGYVKTDVNLSQHRRSTIICYAASLTLIFGSFYFLLGIRLSVSELSYSALIPITGSVAALVLSKPKHSLLGINLWFLSGALSVGYCRTFIHPAANLELLLLVETSA